MKRISTLIALLFAISAIGIAGSSSVTAVNSTDYDYKVPHSAAANQASFWVNHFAKPGRINISCTKYGESHSGWLPGKYEAGVVKAGQWNYVWLQFDNVGRQLNAPQDLSHIFKCNWDTKFIPTYVVDASIIICQDPRAIITLVNDSNVARSFPIRFVRAKDGTVAKFSKTIPAFTTKTLKRRWVLGKTVVKVWGERGELLARIKVNRKNNVGRCPVSPVVFRHA